MLPIVECEAAEACCPDCGAECIEAGIYEWWEVINGREDRSNDYLNNRHKSCGEELRDHSRERCTQLIYCKSLWTAYDHKEHLIIRNVSCDHSQATSICFRRWETDGTVVLVALMSAVPVGVG